MKRLGFALALIAGLLSLQAIAQTEYNFADTTATDTLQFWLRTPVNYDPAHPPAILVWWHGYGADAHELMATGFPALCDQRGWIGASFRGPFDGKHYQGTRGQAQARMMLDWAMQTAPFSMDSIYMAGSSMGAAAGQVWHNNHCGIHDYIPAAAVAGSPILDCALRQEQYVDSGHTLDAMRAAFGGFPWDSDSIAFEYYRASAVRLSDTTKSMHFNALHLPVYNTWGTSDSCWSCEWFAYGHPAQHLDTLRRADHADTTVTFCSGINSHGYPVLVDSTVVAWLSGFSVNRYPKDISINADQSDEYYWTRATLFNTSHTFGRYGVVRDFESRRLDINLVRNLWGLDVEFAFPWPQFDSLSGDWVNLDSVNIPAVALTFSGVPYVRDVRDANGNSPPFAYGQDTLRIILLHGSHYTVLFGYEGADAHRLALPHDFRILAAYPNPFNSQINLQIATPAAAVKEIRLYDVTGRLAKTITASLNPGIQRVSVSGDGLASGVYFVILPESGQAPLKVVLLK
jgi:hypothetical protein